MSNKERFKMATKKDDTVLGYKADSVKSNTAAYCKRDFAFTANTPMSHSPFWNSMISGCKKVIEDKELMKQI